MAHLHLVIFGFAVASLVAASPQSTDEVTTQNSTTEAATVPQTTEESTTQTSTTKAAMDVAVINILDFFTPDPLPDFDKLPDHYRNSTHRIVDVNGTKFLITIDIFKEGGFDGMMEGIELLPNNYTTPAP